MFTIWTMQWTKFHTTCVSASRFVHLLTCVGNMFQFLPHNVKLTHEVLPLNIIIITMNLKRMLIICTMWWLMHHKTHEHATMFNGFSLRLSHVLQLFLSNAKSVCEVLWVIASKTTINLKDIAILCTTQSCKHHKPRQITTRANHISACPERTFLFLLQTLKSTYEMFLITFCITTIFLQHTTIVHTIRRYMCLTVHHSTTRFNCLSIRLGHPLQIFL